MGDKEIVEILASTGGSFSRHESAYIDEGATVGGGTRVWHFAHVMAGARIGSSCVLGQNVNIGGKAVLGNRVKVQNNVSIYDDVVIEDDVFCGPSCVFTNVINPRSFVERKSEYKRTIVCRGASIGANATIVCGVEIGEYALIGAGSVVTRGVPSYAIVYGNPARVRGYVCKCGEKLGPDLCCKACGAKYSRAGNGLAPAPAGT
jgi:N-acetylglucosamine-1-phosphate uridyltransferase (contains nucleotidyltransferase and I-patch acetyltransferase domains)